MRRSGGRRARVAPTTPTSTATATTAGSRTHHRVTANVTTSRPTSRAGPGTPAAAASRSVPDQELASWASASARASASTQNRPTASTAYGTPRHTSPTPAVRPTDQPLRRPIPTNEPRTPAPTAEAAGLSPPPRKATQAAVSTAIAQTRARRR